MGPRGAGLLTVQPPRGDWAMCCGFGVEAHASAKKLVRRGGREFFVACNRYTARIPLQSPVTFPNHRALRLDISIGIRAGAAAAAGEYQSLMAFEVVDCATGKRAIVAPSAPLERGVGVTGRGLRSGLLERLDVELDAVEQLLAILARTTADNDCIAGGINA